MPGEGIYRIVGKTIDRVIIKEHIDPLNEPAIQVFLLFTDHTYYELYSGTHIGFASSIDRGGREAVLGYINDTMEVVSECFLDDEGKPVEVDPRRSK